MEKIELLSRFKIGDLVDVDFGNSKYIRGCEVGGIRFSKWDKDCLYDIVVPYGFGSEYCVLTCLPSKLIVKGLDV
jgi:hypothetical protein